MDKNRKNKASFLLGGALFVALLALVLSGCGGSSSSQSAKTAELKKCETAKTKCSASKIAALQKEISNASSKNAGPKATLTISATDRTGKTETTTLTCKGSSASAEGFVLQTPAQLCGDVAHLSSALTSSSCSSGGTAIGPEKAKITGKVEGKNVNVSYSRTSSCEAAFVKALPLLPLATAPQSGSGKTSTLSGYQPPTRNGLLVSLQGHNVVLTLTQPTAPAIEKRLHSNPITVQCSVSTGTALRLLENTIRWPAAESKISVPITGTAPIKSCKLSINKAVFAEVSFGS